MKTNSKRDYREAIPREQFDAALRPPIDAIIKSAEQIRAKGGDDEDVQQILNAAGGLLDALDRESLPPAAEDAARSATNEPPDVLYIEDDPISFASIRLLLELKRKFIVSRATNGRAGIDLAARNAPKLILLDLNLPDMHGSEVITRLQSNPATARIPVVVVSGDATPSQIERLLVLGARNYVTKPLTVDPFLAVIDDVMQGSDAVPVS